MIQLKKHAQERRPFDNLKGRNSPMYRRRLPSVRNVRRNGARKIGKWRNLYKPIV